MAKQGNSYEVALKPPYLNWGDYRNPTNRDFIDGEGYIPIPRDRAEIFGVFNSNHDPKGLGYNMFYASSADGFLDEVLLLAQGCSNAGDVYAKQFSVKGDLKKIGSWYKYCNAKPGDIVKVRWISSTEILLEFIRT